MMVAQALLALPFVVGITMTAVAGCRANLVLQVRSLGATDVQCLWAVLHEARPGVILSVAAAFGRSISEVGAVLIVGGNIAGHTRVLTTAIVLETSKGVSSSPSSSGAVLLRARTGRQRARSSTCREGGWCHDRAGLDAAQGVVKRFGESFSWT